jgi:hypothetical protein
MDVSEYGTEGSFWTYKSKTGESYTKNQSVRFTIYYQVDPIEGEKQVGHAVFLRDVITNAVFMGNT